jgi:hypothetical protein
MDFLFDQFQEAEQNLTSYFHPNVTLTNLVASFPSMW